jgi:hypothetical protein
VNAVHFDYDLGELPATLETLSVPEGYEQRHQLRVSNGHSERLTVNEHKGYADTVRTVSDLVGQLPHLLGKLHADGTGGAAIDAVATAAIAAATVIMKQMVWSMEH